MELSHAKAALRALEERAGPAGPGRVRLELDETEARLILDNPGARGALSFRMMRQLAEAVQRLGTWEGAWVRIRSTDPRAFCAGGHLGQVQRAAPGPQGAAAMCKAMSAVLDRLAALPQVILAEVDGPAIGGGAELLTAADLRFVGDSGRIHFVHGRLGIAPGWGGTARLMRLVGRHQALRILLEAEPLGPQRALQLGLADGIGAQASQEADQWVAALGLRAPEALRAIKAQVAGSDPVEAFAGVWMGPAHRAALGALRRRD